MEPCTVIATTCSDIRTQAIVQGILETDDLPQQINILEDVIAYPWHISTKYYDASINLCVLNQKTLGNQEFADSVNAVVLCFDSKSENGLSDAEQWLPFIREFYCEVKLLVCDRCYEHSTSTEGVIGINRQTAVTWCIKNGFELVEMNPEIDVESDVEDDFVETVGIKRIVQALEAHMWPNMIRKENSRGRHQVSVKNQDDSGADGSESDLESFESLFQQLSTMKSKANNLPDSDRREFAENVVIAFWRAMGGDESEVAELQSEFDQIETKHD